MPPIIEEIKGKKVAILGFGREGRSTYHYIRKYVPDQMIYISDKQEITDILDENVQFITGKHYQDLKGFDIIIKTPGIVLENLDQLAVMNSQTNLFLKYYGKQTIGITGTKGKSTTSSLLHHILKENGKDVVFLGNIGVPAFDALDDIQVDTLIVFELSCHQLEFVQHNPHIAVLLNIFEEHLDHYGTFEKYVHAKENVWRFQGKHDVLLCEKSLIKKEITSQIVSVSMEDEKSDIYASIHELIIKGKRIEILNSPLLGHHNMYDIAIDIYIASMFHIATAQALCALQSFHPLPHRLQFVGKIHDILWYDDSISTICETTIQALQTLEKTETLLLGGMDRGIDYTPLANHLRKHPVSNIILLPDSGTIVGKLLEGLHCIHVNNLKDAVQLAKKITKPDTIALLSPAAASYGFFRDFEDRGNQFQAYIKDEY